MHVVWTYGGGEMTVTQEFELRVIRRRWKVVFPRKAFARYLISDLEMLPRTAAFVYSETGDAGALSLFFEYEEPEADS